MERDSGIDILRILEGVSTSLCPVLFRTGMCCAASGAPSQPPTRRRRGRATPPRLSHGHARLADTTFPVRRAPSGPRGLVPEPHLHLCHSALFRPGHPALTWWALLLHKEHPRICPCSCRSALARQLLPVASLTACPLPRSGRMGGREAMRAGLKHHVDLSALARLLDGSQRPSEPRSTNEGHWRPAGSRRGSAASRAGSSAFGACQARARARAPAACTSCSGCSERTGARSRGFGRGVMRGGGARVTRLAGRRWWSPPGGGQNSVT